MLICRIVRSVAVVQPLYAEAIDEYAETRGPKRFLEWRHNPTVLGQFVKDTLGVSRALDLKREREAIWLLILDAVSSTSHLLSVSLPSFQPRLIHLVETLICFSSVGVALPSF